MALYELDGTEIREIAETTFAARNILERGDLQRLLREKIDVIVPDAIVLAEEFGDWEDSRRRIDLLCLDDDANLVVVELKRTDDGGHMDLQAIRYAAMVSTMTFDGAVSAHTEYLSRIGKELDARAVILDFLEWETPNEDEFARDVRIVLVAADFSKEITTAVLWLNEREMDIRCVKLRLHDFNGRTLMDVQQLIPLPEAQDYQVSVRAKEAEKREARKIFNFDLSHYDLSVGGQITGKKCNARRLVLAVARTVAKQKGFEAVAQLFPAGSRSFIAVGGNCDAIEFAARASQLKSDSGKPIRLIRYFCADDELFRGADKTYALTNQWTHSTALPAVDKIIGHFPELEMTYAKVD